MADNSHTGLPLISVIISTYNGEGYLSQTIESVLNQTHSNLEVVIVDDGSTDHTIGIVEQYQRKDGRIKLFVQSHQGFAASRNRAFREAGGEWIAIIDHDDLCYPTRLEKQLDLSRRYPEADFCFCDTDFIDEDNQIVGSQLAQFAIEGPFIPKGRAALMLLQKGGFIDSESVFIRKGIAEKIGLFDTRYLYAADYDFFIRLGFEVNLCFTKEKLSAWRLHPKQATENHKVKLNFEIMHVLLKYMADRRVGMDTRGRLCIKMAKLLVRTVLQM